MNILLIGAPNAGKGSVGEVLVDELKMVLVSAGALFREEMAKESELGKEAEAYIKNGVLVPNELTFKLIVDRIERDDCRNNGFILDGFPRSMEQVEFLDKYLEESNTTIDKVIYIEEYMHGDVQRPMNLVGASRADTSLIYVKMN